MKIKYESKNKTIYDTEEEAINADIYFDLKELLGQDAAHVIIKHLDDVREILKTEVIIQKPSNLDFDFNQPNGIQPYKDTVPMYTDSAKVTCNNNTNN